MAGLMEKVKAQQQAENLTQAELARRLSISEAYLSLLYHGKREPNVDVLSRLRVMYPELAPEIDLFWSRRLLP